jgi:hypothetical protein
MPDSPNTSTLYRNARREAWVCLILFALALLWTVGYCYLRGYEHDPGSWLVRSGIAVNRPPGEVVIVLGLPDWVFWGIFLPWVLCVTFTMLYSSFGMSDDDLGGEAKGAGDGH